MHSSSEKYPPREIRHIHYISQYTMNVRFIKGLNNSVADALFRFNVGVVHTTNSIDFCKIVMYQKHDRYFLIRDSNSSAL